ncbi:MAG: M20 family peptidase [Pseudomonadales bacterium]
MRNLLLGLLGALALLVAVVVVRTLLHQPLAGDSISTTVVTPNIDAERAARHLAEAVRFRTVSHQQPEDFEPAEFEGFIDWVARTYPAFHSALSLTRHGNYSLLYRWQGSDPSLAPVLITGHYDVVPVIPGTEALWSQPPFGGVVEGDIVWGRGALDDKSAVIAQLEAATHLLAEGFTPARTLYFSFGHDEEVGGPNGAGAVTAYLREQGVQLAWSLDEGSFLFEGMLPGVEQLMAAINVAEKGSVTLNVIAHADGGHSSMPPQQTAVGRLAEAITRLETTPVPGGLSGLSEQMFDTASRYMPFTFRLLFANRWLFDSLVDDQLSATTFGNAMLRTTTAPTMLRASPKVNVLPIEAVATVNFRVHPRDSVEDVINHVKAVVENEFVTVEVPPGAGIGASEVSDWNSEGYTAIADAVRQIYGDVVVTPGLMIAGSDTRHYGQVADNSFRFNPMRVTPEDITGFHGTNEKISVANLAQGVRTYVQIIRNGTGG